MVTVAALLLAAAGPATADTTLLFDVAGQPSAKVQLVDGFVRMDSGPQGWLLYDADKDTAYMVSPSDKSYTRIDRAGIAQIGGHMDAARAQIEKELANLPPEQRAMMESMMGQMMGKPTDKPKRPTPKATGGTRTVVETKCTDYSYPSGPGKTDTLCLAKADALKLGKGEYDTARKMYALLTALSDATGFAAVATPNMDDLEGLPIVIEQNGNPQQRLTAVSHEKIDRTLYSVPPGYTERDASSLK